MGPCIRGAWGQSVSRASPLPGAGGARWAGPQRQPTRRRGQTQSGRRSPALAHRRRSGFRIAAVPGPACQAQSKWAKAACRARLQQGAPRAGALGGGSCAGGHGRAQRHRTGTLRHCLSGGEGGAPDHLQGAAGRSGSQPGRAVSTRFQKLLCDSKFPGRAGQAGRYWRARRLPPTVASSAAGANTAGSGAARGPS